MIRYRGGSGGLFRPAVLIRRKYEYACAQQTLG